MVNSNTVDKVANSNAINKVVNSNIVNKVVNSNTVNKVANSNTVNKVANSNTVNKMVNSNTVNKVANSNTVNKVVNSNVANKVANSNAVSKVANSNVANKVANSNTVNKVANNNTVSKVANSNLANKVATNKTDETKKETEIQKAAKNKTMFKHGNNGSVSGNTFCKGEQWHGWSKQYCKFLKDNNTSIIHNCDFNPGKADGNYSALCTDVENKDIEIKPKYGLEGSADVSGGTFCKGEQWMGWSAKNCDLVLNNNTNEIENCDYNLLPLGNYTAICYHRKHEIITDEDIRRIVPKFMKFWLVRYLTYNSRTFHPADDNLYGNAQYGKISDFNNNFSIRFANRPFGHFLFISGDKKNWAIIRKTEVAKCGTNQFLRIEKSSISEVPYKVLSINKQGYKKETWIGLQDYNKSIINETLLYGENSSNGSTKHGNSYKNHGGLYVYVGDYMKDEKYIREGNQYMHYKTCHRTLSPHKFLY